MRETIGELFAIWDSLAERRALPEELYVVELGVGNGNQARTWLDTFVEMDRAHGREYYRRLHYLMCDYSPHVLELARATVARATPSTSARSCSTRMRPMTSLAFLRFKVFLVYISNVYDNLPTDEIATIGQREHLVETRAYLPAAEADAIAARRRRPSRPRCAGWWRSCCGWAPSCWPRRRRGTSADAARRRRLLAGLLAGRCKLQERYVPLHGLDTYEIAPGISGELLRPAARRPAATSGCTSSNGAAASFAETLPLLHPYGRLQCHDIVVTDPHQYRTGFRGPGKYDGSVVNWVNGPLLAHIWARARASTSRSPRSSGPGATSSR